MRAQPSRHRGATRAGMVRCLSRSPVRSTWLDGGAATSATDPSTVGLVLTALHHIRPAGVTAAIESYETWRRQELRRARRGLLAARPILKGSVANRVASRIDQLTADLDRFDVLRIEHGDFWHGNMVVRNDRLVGVLDWESCAVGDPAIDQCGLWYFGDDWASRVIEAVSPSAHELSRVAAWRIVRESSRLSTVINAEMRRHAARTRR
jgi:aminoglycoside phosphotransferase (APT) family kinase protein